LKSVIKRYLPYGILIIMFIWHSVLFAQQRFPRPEFDSGYTYPAHQMPNQRGPMWEYLDVAVLVAALAFTAWLALKRRSRSGIIWMSVFSLAYFGFYRQGCICSVGSVQNISLALFNSNYAMPLSALLFFVVPLIFALLFGRVFCAGVCPLGAIQELTGFKPVRIHKSVESILSAIPFVYLGLAVLFAATGSQFIICRYDPFVGIFRLDAPYTMIIFGSLLLLTGIFVNRPYCRYLCPYGVLQNIFSRFSGRHLTITPAECTNCRLCEESCPYDAILPSDVGANIERKEVSRKRFLIYFLLIPVMAAAGAILLSNLALPLSRVNSTVRLADEIRYLKVNGGSQISVALKAFEEAGKTEEQLFAEEQIIKQRISKGSLWVGIFLGLSLGIGLFSQTMRKPRIEYKPHRGRCFSCGKCFEYCPVVKKI
jgi:NosR/NirI family nitrous oxide reductase transcriptional regulator